MKTTLKLTAIAAMSAFILTGCATQDKSAEADAQLQQQAVLGLNWIQQSGEYQALSTKHTMRQKWHLITLK